MPPSARFVEPDFAVVGAGATGAACAAFLAEAGFEVACFERRALEDAGARWVNGVPRAAFAAAKIALPEPPEHLGGPEPLHLVLACGDDDDAPITIASHDVIRVDMRLLVRRLQARARAAGVRFVPQVRVAAAREEGERVRLVTEDGEVTARWVIDASGLAGARLLGQADVARTDLCAAAQAVHAIADEAAARRFVAGHGAQPGESVAFVGKAGGFSVLNVFVDPDVRTVSVLTGSIPALGHPSGRAMLDRFVRDNAWVGQQHFGGSAAIPLRRPYARMTSARVALLGDAACQVFAAHGSGVGSGLIAARTLADTLAAGGTLRQWEVRWHREHGGLLAAFDVLRRYNQSLDDVALTRLFRSHLLDEELLRAGLDQEEPKVSARSLLAQAPKVARLVRAAPADAGRALVALARSRAVSALYRLYPDDERKVAAWNRAVERLVG